ncbi:ABC transporter permease [uncultured Gemmiger sp.]|uniref:ABC transporter permease n=1 Tax=uncultured Gemmiger sp. TaxID=1623490 RepID=UPI0025F0D86C|nr:ABC transporter permease [uncultured Gemmiger sp.]
MAENIANKWAPLETNAGDREKIWSKSRTFAGDVWFRFRHKPTAIAGFVLIVVLALFALVGPLFTAYDYAQQNLEVVNVPPVMKVYQAPDGSYMYITTALKVVSVSQDGQLGGQLKRVREEDAKSMTIYDVNGSEVALYYGGSTYVMADESTGNIYPSRLVWNKSYILGTDSLGRDILTRLMYGTRISLMVALMATLVNMVIGILYGGIAGYVGGTVDMVMMRIVDIISTIPLTLYVILIMQVLGSGLQSIIVALGSVYWVDMARVVRGQILSLKQQEFVVAAKTIGSSSRTILFDHLIPNALGSILVTMTMLIPSAIFMEAFLGYLGIGLQPPLASLGTMCNDASANLRTSPHELLIPALMICAIMFAFNFVGDGLRDALDPKLKK